jgi:serine/threonine protein kinase
LAARNVLLTHDLKAKVADFGFSSRLYFENDDKQTVGAQQDKFPFHSSAYEILTNGIAILEKSDIWSFGILLWEIFYFGTALPYADTIADRSGLSNLVNSLKIGHRLEKPPLCPKRLYNLMLQCWELNPQVRPTFSIVKEKLLDFQASNVRNSDQEHSNQEQSN